MAGSTAIARARAALSARSSQIAALKAPAATLGNGGIMLAGSAAAGVLDAKVGEVAGVKPSIAGGFALAGAGIAMRSPKAIYAASGMLAPHAYQTAYDWADSMGNE